MAFPFWQMRTPAGSIKHIERGPKGSFLLLLPYVIFKPVWDMCLCIYFSLIRLSSLRSVWKRGEERGVLISEEGETGFWMLSVSSRFCSPAK